jgi:hypothetical protein
MNDMMYRGALTTTGRTPFLLADDGTLYLEDEIIWSGYLSHWSGRKVCARRLLQKDYEARKPIIILWPDIPALEEPFVDLYFNERLVKYPVSFLGHLAVIHQSRHTGAGRYPGIITIGIYLCENSFWIPGQARDDSKKYFSNVETKTYTIFIFSFSPLLPISGSSSAWLSPSSAMLWLVFSSRHFPAPVSRRPSCR